MKVIVAGSRTCNNEKLIYDSITTAKFKITELVSGHAIGVDRIAEKWANKYNIPIKIFLPDYNIQVPHTAPLIRNTHMANYADALIAIWENSSNGTKHMINQMKLLNKPVFIVKVKDTKIISCEYVTYQGEL